MGFDALMATASRLARRPVGAVTRAQVDEVLSRAVDVLKEHPNRAPEITLAVMRLGIGDSTRVAPFAEAFANQAVSRLRETRTFEDGMRPSPRERVREAFVAFSALRDLNVTTAVVNEALVFLEKEVVKDAGLLEAPAIAAALPRASKGGALSLALQQAIGKLTVSDLSPADLRSVAVGLAGTDEIQTEVGKAIATAVAAKHRAMPLPLLCDTLFALSQVASKTPALKDDIAGQLFLVWPGLSELLQQSLETKSLPARSVEVLGMLAVRWGAAFENVVLKPCGKAMADFARESPEVLRPWGRILKSAAGPEVWAALLQDLVIEILPKIERGPDGAMRVVAVLEDIAVAEFGAADSKSEAADLGFPFFFDLGFEEIQQRLADIQGAPGLLQRAVRLIGRNLPVTRPDLLSSAEAALAGAVRDQVQDLKLSELALCLSALATVFTRRVAATGESPPDGLEKDALDRIAEAFSVAGSALAIQELGATDLHATCLAASAFSQASAKSPALLEPGLQVLRRVAEIWQPLGSASADGPTMDQAHIFLMVFLNLCVERGGHQVPPSVIAVLQDIELRAEARPNDKESQLCLHVLKELASEQRCPMEVREALAPSMPEAKPETSAPRSRMQQHFKDVGEAWAADPRSTRRTEAEEDGTKDKPSPWKRFFGFG